MCTEIENCYEMKDIKTDVYKYKFIPNLFEKLDRDPINALHYVPHENKLHIPSTTGFKEGSMLGFFHSIFSDHSEWLYIIKDLCPTAVVSSKHNKNKTPSKVKNDYSITFSPFTYLKRYKITPSNLKTIANSYADINGKQLWSYDIPARITWFTLLNTSIKNPTPFGEYYGLAINFTQLYKAIIVPKLNIL